MSKKTLILLVAVAAVLLAGIVGAVALLYSGRDGTGAKKEAVIVQKGDVALLRAVPSDAVAVMLFSDLERGMPVLTHFCSGAFKSFAAAMVAEKLAQDVPVAVSLHYSGSIVPLVIFGDGADTLAARAAQAGLSVGRDSLSAERAVLVASPSETIVNSALRHLASGASIIDNPSFASVFARGPQANLALFANDYADRLLALYDGALSRHASFLRKAADWVSFSMKGSSSEIFSVDAAYGSDPSYYMTVLEKLQPGTSRLGEIAPSNTVFALALSPGRWDAFHTAYGRYLDATQRLAARDRTAFALRESAGVLPSKWAENVQEVAALEWKLNDGSSLKAVAVRQNTPAGKELEVVEYGYAGFAACAFGEIFSVPDERWSVRLGSWTVSGSREAVEDLVSAYTQQEVLGDVLIRRDCSLTCYYTSNDTKILTRTRGGITLDVKQAVVLSNRTPELVVEIPQGPFTVTNCQTNKKNTFYQNEVLSLCLKDENGKGLWGVPFKQPICGYVSDVDYYNNGKIQFLFGAGSSLYLISRLGAFVSGFPVDLGKEILLGPAVYDFTGSKGYTVMVLHKDNKVEMYNLHGQKPQSWKGITADDVIVSMPELVTASGQRYWKVSTTRETLYFGFDGGEPIKDKKILNAFK